MEHENTKISETVAAHYGYKSLSSKRGMWPIAPGVLDRLSRLPEVLDEKKKFRVIFDYDPEFQRALIQIFEDQTSTQGQPLG